MNWKWSGVMNKTVMYFCEGEDDLKLIDALKVLPYKILPGKSKKLNVVQTLIPKSVLVSIRPGTTVVFVFDTDVIVNLDIVKKNITNIRKYCQGVTVVSLLQVKNLEDELVRCTTVKDVKELTKSKSLSNFKAEFKKMRNGADGRDIVCVIFCIIKSLDVPQDQMRSCESSNHKQLQSLPVYM